MSSTVASESSDHHDRPVEDITLVDGIPASTTRTLANTKDNETGESFNKEASNKLEEKEKLERQEKARKDLADAVVKGREQKQARSDDAKRKILIGAYLLKKHDNDIKKLLRFKRLKPLKNDVDSRLRQNQKKEELKRKRYEEKLKKLE